HRGLVEGMIFDERWGLLEGGLMVKQRGAHIPWVFALCPVDLALCHLTERAALYGLDDGDIYMSTYENRFRLFSSVEYEGQLYMTPLNFIESVTLNEPKSECVSSDNKLWLEVLQS
uniref:Uncharacterized protein n=1 Tax=Echeneis naucrates TaxID=173247 RepID=A0A665WRY8_ECHNA